MPYILVKGPFGHAGPSQVVTSSREKDVRKQLQIPDNVTQTELGFTVQKSPVAVLDALEMKGWRVINVTGPEPGSWLYVWTLHACV